MTNKRLSLFNRINFRIMTMLLLIFLVAVVIISIINNNNIRNTYEQSYTDRVLVTNALMANAISSDDVQYFIDRLNSLTQSDPSFKDRQQKYYHDRNEYWEYEEGQAPSELVQSLTDFRNEMSVIKEDGGYWDIIAELKNYKSASKSAYLYVMADMGLKTNDGKKLYTFIFSNDDERGADSPIDVDGLGSSDVSLPSIMTVHETKKQMDWVEFYDDVYGELYFAYAPIINSSQEVIAVFGTDIYINDMNDSIAYVTLLTNIIFIAVFIVVMLSIFMFLHLSIITPLKGLTATAQQLSEGNIYASTSKVALSKKTEISVLAHAIKEMSSVYQNMVKNSAGLFNQAKIGKLDVRTDASKFKGDIFNFITQTNDTLDATTKYLNNIPESIFIMNKEMDIYFCNENFKRCFDVMSGLDFMTQLYPPSDNGLAEGIDVLAVKNFLKGKLTEALSDKSYSATVWIGDTCYSVLFREIMINEDADNSVLVIAIDITDLVREKENAQAAAKAKSDFLSRMSHEMRTPMNAIIGMSKIAASSDDISRLRYCLATIDVSAAHLLGIINDVLDMSKIEAGKFELENIPINIEKILMNVCNLVIDNMEKKHQKFGVILDRGLELNYLGDGLRLSQVITNLLSNAVKFTPDGGKINLSVKTASRENDICTLRFSISDTGIGMTAEQISRLFNVFEQANGSVTRKYGGTGLGLAISKSIVEKMGGRIWVESTPNVGSTFIFEVKLERSSHQNTVIFDGIRPENLNILIVEGDEDIRTRFVDITTNFGINVDAAGTADEAERMVEATLSGAKAGYDIIFMAYDLPETDAISLVNRLSEKLDKNTVIIITTFLEWHRIEGEAIKSSVTRYITKPFFPSSILDAINDIVGNRLKSLDIKTEPLEKTTNLSDLHILLAEDVEINREIFISLLEETKISIDIAENGQIAVDKFKQNPYKYDLIIMDIQMPEMDGLMATRTIRSLDAERAKSIPIIAMTANAFKEDIDRCIEAGMNDHLAKPIDENLVIEKIIKYTGKL